MSLKDYENQGKNIHVMPENDIRGHIEDFEATI